MAKIAYMEPQFVTLTKCEILVENDSDGSPTNMVYNKQTDIYIDANEILAVSKKFDPYANEYLPVCVLMMKNAFQVDQSSFGLHVTDSYSTIKGYMDRDCNDLCDE